MVVVVDANVWVSSLIPAETHYLASSAWLAAWTAEGHRIVVLELFVVEVGGTMARRRNDSSAGARALAAVRADPSVEIMPVPEATWLAAPDTAARLLLRGADAVYAALALALGVPLVTWDLELVRRALTEVDVRTPDQMPV